MYKMQDVGAKIDIILFLHTLYNHVNFRANTALNNHCNLVLAYDYPETSDFIVGFRRFIFSKSFFDKRHLTTSLHNFLIRHESEVPWHSAFRAFERWTDVVERQVGFWFLFSFHFFSPFQLLYFSRYFVWEGIFPPTKSLLLTRVLSLQFFDELLLLSSQPQSHHWSYFHQQHPSKWRRYHKWLSMAVFLLL